MATIILPPNYSEQDEIIEFSNQSYGELMVTDMLFSYKLDATEKMVKFGLTVTPDPTEYGITIEDGHYFGHYQDYFEQNGANLFLTLRDRKTLEIFQVNGFKNLPKDPTTADCIEFQPPPPQKQVFTIKCSLTFQSTVPPGVTETITKSITQTLYGNSTAWAGKLRDYIFESGPFPGIV
ncbi:MAG: hypothetical protein ACRC3J_05650 [Culicoidibacterales bacterium]